MIEKLADALLRRVYYPITAVVCLDDRDDVIHIELLDSLFALPGDALPARTHRIVIIFSHPDGSMELMQEEILSLRRIASCAQTACVSVYIYGEDIGLCEVDKGRILGYNDENVI